MSTKSVHQPPSKACLSCPIVEAFLAENYVLATSAMCEISDRVMNVLAKKRQTSISKGNRPYKDGERQEFMSRLVSSGWTQAEAAAQWARNRRRIAGVIAKESK